MTRALVIGANGFLGRHLCDFLTTNNDRVIAVYNNNIDNIGDQVTAVSIQEIKDIDPTTIDVVYYLSGNYMCSHQQLIDISCTFLLQIIQQFQSAKLIYISSTNVYGTSNIPITETTCFNNPNIYGLSKIASEFIVRSHPNFRIIRFCYLYGPNLKNNSFLTNLVEQALQGKIILYGRGERKQDYLFIDDAIRLCYKVFLYSENDVFLGATGTSYTNKYIAELVANSLGVPIEYKGEDSGSSLFFSPLDTSNKLKWEPQVSISDGIKKMLDARIDLR